MAKHKVVVSCTNCGSKCIVKFDDRGDDDKEVVACPLCGEEADTYCDIDEVE